MRGAVPSVRRRAVVTVRRRCRTPPTTGKLPPATRGSAKTCCGRRRCCPGGRVEAQLGSGPAAAAVAERLAWAAADLNGAARRDGAAGERVPVACRRVRDVSPGGATPWWACPEVARGRYPAQPYRLGAGPVSRRDARSQIDTDASLAGGAHRGRTGPTRSTPPGCGSVATSSRCCLGTLTAWAESRLSSAATELWTVSGFLRLLVEQLESARRRARAAPVSTPSIS